MQGNKIIMAVDFDGTLCAGAYPGIGEPNQHLIDLLIKLRNEGKVLLILWTCRKGRSLDLAVEWCTQHGLEFDAINENVIDTGDTYGWPKIYADYYIDDRAIHPYSLRSEVLI